MNKNRIYTRFSMKKVGRAFGLLLAFAPVVLRAVPSITVQPASQVIDKGATLTLSVTASGALAYQWFKDGTKLAGKTQPTLSVAGAAISDSGVYTVAAVSSDGMALSRPADVAVGSPSLLAWGLGNCGQIGTGITKDALLPVRVATNVVTAAAGHYHSLFVKSDHTLWAMGQNIYGQLGIGTSVSTNLPAFVASDVLVAAAGTYHSLFVKTDGTLWTMGKNDYGQLGDGTTDNASLPVQIAANVVAVAAGDTHSLFIKGDGTLWAMGGSSYKPYSLAVSKTPVQVDANVVAVSAGEYHTVYVKSDGTLWTKGGGPYGQAGTGGQIAESVVSAAAGDRHTLFAKTDGSLWTLGCNMHGALGNGTTTATNYPGQVVASGVVKVSGAFLVSLFGKSDGSTWIMGYNENGALGIGTTKDALVPTPVLCGSIASVGSGPMAFHVLAIGPPTLAISTPCGTVEPAVGAYEVNLNSVLTNTLVTSPIVTDGSTQYVCTGWAMTGGTPASGNGTNAIVTVTNECAALRWIWQSKYRLDATATGTGGSVDPSSSWVDAGKRGQVTAVADAGYQIKKWTGDASGSANPLFLTMDRAKTVVASFAVSPTITVQPVSQTLAESNTLALSVTATDALGYQWWKDGVRLAGKTGPTLTVENATTRDSGVYTVVITNADTVTISLPTDVAVGHLSLQAWGYDGYGQFGDGNCIKCQIANPDPAFTLSRVVTAATGWEHSLFVKTDGTLWTVGYNGYGQLGNGTTTDACQPVHVADNVRAVAADYYHSLFVKSDGTLWSMGFNNYGQLGKGTTEITNSTPVCVASNVVALAAGYYHSLFVKSDGTLWSMGFNNYGQLGDGTTMNASQPVCVAGGVVAVAAGSYHSLFVKADGTLWSMGWNGRGQLGDGSITTRTTPVFVTNNVVTVSSGDRHSLFVRTDGTLWGMGYNAYGQLGTGTAEDTNSLPVHVANDVAAAAAGQYNSLFVKTDGTVWSMGNNMNGQLGDGTTANALSPVQTLCDPPASIHTGAAALHVLAVVASGAAEAASVTVDTPRGTAVPAAGDYTVDLNADFTGTMTTPIVTDGATQYVCTGWAATGATPSSGDGTTANITVTDATAVLSWLWRTDYRLTATAGAGGSVAPASVWVGSGTTTQLTVTADAGYMLDAWSGDASGSANPLSVLMNGPKTIAAAFIAAYTAGDHPTSVRWLRDYGIGDTDPATENADPDGDGVPVWAEYVAGTDPTNASSKLVITHCEQAYGTNYTETVYYRDATNYVFGGETRSWPGGWVTQRVYEVTGFAVRWPSVTGRVYNVKTCTNLAEAAWANLPGATGLPGASPSMVYTNPVPPAAGSNLFFKVEVNLP